MRDLFFPMAVVVAFLSTWIYFDYKVTKIKQEIINGYTIDIIQARQIQTLFNLEIRRESPDILERLQREREKHNANEHERST